MTRDEAFEGLMSELPMHPDATVTLTLPVAYAQVLHDKLDILCRECFFGAGVDIWLAPGGYLNVSETDKDAEVFLTPDPVEETIAIDAIHTQLRELLNITTSKEDCFDDPDTGEPLRFDVNGVLLPPLTHGSPGIGKTMTVEEIEEYTHSRDETNPEAIAANEREAETKG